MIHSMMASILQRREPTEEEKSKIKIAAQTGDVNTLQSLLSSGVDITGGLDSVDYTALHIAAMNGYYNVVDYLINHGARVNDVTKYNQTPLNLAARKGHTKIVKYLERDITQFDQESIKALENKLKNAELLERNSQLKIETDKVVELQEENQKLIQKQMDKKVEHEDKVQWLDEENVGLQEENKKYQESIKALENKLKMLNAELLERNYLLKIETDKVVELQEENQKFIQKQMDKKVEHEDKVQWLDEENVKLHEENKKYQEDKIALESKLQLLNTELLEKNSQLEIENDENFKLQEEIQRLIEDEKKKNRAHLEKLQKMNAERLKEISQDDAEVKDLIDKMKAESEEASTHEPENDATISGTIKPSMRLLNRPEMRNKIAICWEYLGFELLNEKQCIMLEIIKQNNRDVQARCSQMLRYWLEVDTKASWNRLIKALEVIHQESTAKYIESDILKVTNTARKASSTNQDDNEQDDQHDDQPNDQHVFPLENGVPRRRCIIV